MQDLEQLYRVRFDERERAAKAGVWKVLCERFFQCYVDPEATVLDLACGFGEFSRFIRAARKIAVDVEPSAGELLPEGVERLAAPADRLDAVADATVDVCFTSNFFEHLPDKAAMDRVLAEILRVLKPGGRFFCLQPNIKYAVDVYWDFYDHHLPLSHLSAAEGLEKSGFVVLKTIPRFLPWSTKSRFPKHPALVRLYLALPWAWRLFGKQFFLLAEKPRLA